MAIQPLEAAELALDGVYELLRHGRIEEARTQLATLSARAPASEDVADLARKLARPRGILAPGPPAASRERERAWLRAHAGEHRGNWLAVSGDSLIAAGPDYREVLARVRETVGVDNVVVFFQPGTATHR